MNSICRTMIVAFLLIVCATVNASTINTLPSWDGSSYVYPLGEPVTATYGQTFTVGTDTALQNFSFQLEYDAGSVAMNFRAYVMQWAGNHATGPVLFQSPIASVLTTDTAFTQFVFNTGSLLLQSGMTYVAFLNDSLEQDGGDATARMGFLNSDAYSGGSFVFINNGTNFNAVTTGSWTDFGDSSDSAFTATFAAAPLPGSLRAGLTLAIAAGLFRFVSHRSNRRKSIAD